MRPGDHLPRVREVGGGDGKSLNPYTKTDLSFPFPLFSIEYKIDLTHLTHLTIVIE